MNTEVADIDVISVPLLSSLRRRYNQEGEIRTLTAVRS